MQFVREISDVVRKTGSGLLNLVASVSSTSLSGLDSLMRRLKPLSTILIPAKPLADVVVELACDASPFHFLRGNQAPGHILIPLVVLSKRPLTLAQGMFDPSTSDTLNQQPGNQRRL